MVYMTLYCACYGGYIHRPASLTHEANEESGACYLETEGSGSDLIIEPLNIMTPEDIDDDNDSTKFPTTPPIYRLMVNDEEWRNHNRSHSHHIKSPKSPSPKTPSHKLRQELLRLSRHQCTV